MIVASLQQEDDQHHQNKHQSTKMPSELTPKQAQRYHELFKKLDTNSDGKIDVSDLLELFERAKESNGTKKTDAADNNGILNDESQVNRAKVSSILTRLYA